MTCGSPEVWARVKNSSFTVIKQFSQIVLDLLIELPSILLWSLLFKHVPVSLYSSFLSYILPTCIFLDSDLESSTPSQIFAICCQCYLNIAMWSVPNYCHRCTFYFLLRICCVYFQNFKLPKFYNFNILREEDAVINSVPTGEPWLWVCVQKYHR
jgi:hypothetical protein